MTIKMIPHGCEGLFATMNELVNKGLSFGPEWWAKDLRDVVALNTPYPPHDLIAIGDDSFELRIAVAGYRPDEITVQVEAERLIISCNAQDATEADEVERRVLYRGIAKRAFRRVLDLGRWGEVKNAELRDGILTITVQRVVPDTHKPRKVDIKVA